MKQIKLRIYTHGKIGAETNGVKCNDLIDRYIHFYNHECFQIKTGVASLKLRHSG